MKIGVVDYKAGNLKSVETALKYLKANFIISGNSRDLAGCGKIIFPGVGEALSAMNVLNKSGLAAFMKNSFASDIPILGICLGSQIVLDTSDENNAVCLGLVPGRAVRFTKTSGLKIPHMGWNQVEIIRDHYIFNGVPDNSSFYFVHSYYPAPQSSNDVVAVTEYGKTFSSVFTSRNLVAVQFHPEKSGENGLQMLLNFIKH